MERMGSDQRSTATAVVKKLFETPYEFSFLQALRIFQKILPNGAAIGKTLSPQDDPVLFTSSYSYSLPSSDISRITTEESGRPTIEVNFWNLAGPHGALPAPLSEKVVERSRNGDDSLKDFVNIFNHRLLGVYYSVAEKYSFVLSPKSVNNTSAGQILSAVAGANLDEGQYGRVPVHRLTKYAGLLWQRPRSAAGLEQLLKDYFRAPIQVDQFTGSWVDIHQRQRTFIGRKQGRNHVLGKSTFLGRRFWQSAHHFVVNIGPLSSEKFHQFIPTGEHYGQMCDLIKLYAPMELTFQLKVLLREGEALQPVEAQNASVENRLGWTAVLNEAPREYTVKINAA